MRNIAAFLAAASAAFFSLSAPAQDIWIDRPAGIVAAFDFSGHRTTSPTGLTSTLSGSASVPTGTRYLSLSGTGDWMTSADAPELDVGDNFTVAFWVRPNAPGTAATRVPASRYNAALNKRSWLVSFRYADSPQRILAVVGTGSAIPILYAFNVTLPTSGWHHVAMVYSNSAGAGNRAKVYYDGVELSATTIIGDASTTPFATDLGVRLGNDGDGTAATAWKGDIADFRQYNRPLPPAEIAQLFNHGSARIGSGATP